MLVLGFVEDVYNEYITQHLQAARHITRTPMLPMTKKRIGAMVIMSPHVP